MKNDEPVQVVVRIRPEQVTNYSLQKSNKENFVKESENEECIVPKNEKTVILLPDTKDGSDNFLPSKKRGKGKGKGRALSRAYTFDGCFGPYASQQQVYVPVRPLVHSAVRGYSATVFAYGCTGSGKTYTMSGTPRNPGVISRALHDVFSLVKATTDHRPDSLFLIRVSYVELYNNEFRNLLQGCENQIAEETGQNDPRLSWSPSQAHPNLHSDKIEVRESPVAGVFLSGPRLRVVVRSVEQVQNLIEEGNKYRMTGTTMCNERSSRSHAVLTLQIESTSASAGGSDANNVAVGKLHLVDLAGSERLSLSKAEGKTQKETQAINLSLTALGDVLSALSRNAQIACGEIQGTQMPVPYRNSKLTHLLKDSLGGNSRTLMICTLRNGVAYRSQTTIALMYATRARQIRNRATINTEAGDAFGIRQVTAELEQLRRRLQERTAEFDSLMNWHISEGEENTRLKQRLIQLQQTNQIEKGELETKLSQVIHSQASQLTTQKKAMQSLESKLGDECKKYKIVCIQQHQQILQLKSTVQALEGGASGTEVQEMQRCLQAWQRQASDSQEELAKVVVQLKETKTAYETTLRRVDTLQHLLRSSELKEQQLQTQIGEFCSGLGVQDPLEAIEKIHQLMKENIKRSGDLDKESARLKAEIFQLKQENRVLETDLDRTQKENNRLEEELKKARNNSQREHGSLVEKENSDLKETIRTLRIELTNALHKNEDLRACKERLEIELEEVSTEKTSEMEKLKNDLDCSIKTNSDKTSTIEKLMADIKSYKASNEKLKLKFASDVSTFEQGMTNIVDKKDRDIHMLEKQKVEAEESLADLQSQIKRIQLQLCTTQREAEEVIRANVAENHALKKELEQLSQRSTDNSISLSIVQDAKIEINSLKEKLARSDSKCSELQHRFDEKCTENSKLLHMQHDSKTIIEELQLQATQVQQDLKKETAIYQESRKKYEELWNEFSTFKQEKNALVTANDGWEKSYNDLKQKFDQTVERNEELLTANGGWEKSYNELKEKCDKTVEKNEILQEKMASINDSYKEQIDSVTTQKSMLQRELDELRTRTESESVFAKSAKERMKQLHKEREEAERKLSHHLQTYSKQEKDHETQLDHLESTIQMLQQQDLKQKQDIQLLKDKMRQAICGLTDATNQKKDVQNQAQNQIESLQKQLKDAEQIAQNNRTSTQQQTEEIDQLKKMVKDLQLASHKKDREAQEREEFLNLQLGDLQQKLAASQTTSANNELQCAKLLRTIQEKEQAVLKSEQIQTHIRSTVHCLAQSIFHFKQDFCKVKEAINMFQSLEKDTHFSQQIMKAIQSFTTSMREEMSLEKNRKHEINVQLVQSNELIANLRCDIEKSSIEKNRIISETEKQFTSEIKILQEKIQMDTSQYKSELRKMQLQKEELQEQVTGLQVREQLLCTEKMQLEEKIVQLQEEIATVKSKLSSNSKTWETSEAELQNKVRELEDELMLTRQNKETWIKKSTDFETKLASILNENSNLKRVLKNAQDENGTVKSSLSLAQEQSDKIQKELTLSNAELMQKVHNLENAEANAKENIASLTKKCTEFESQLALAIDENAELKTLLQNIQHEKGKSDSSLLAVREQTERMECEWNITKSDLLNKIEELEDELISTKRKKETWVKKCTGFETELKSAVDENSTLKELLQNVQDEKGATKSSLLLAQEQTERMRQEWKISKIDLVNKVQELEDEVLATKQIKESLTQKCKNLESQLKSAQDESEKFQRLLQTAKDEMGTIQLSLLATDRERETMKQEWQMKKTELLNTVQKLEDEVASSKNNQEIWVKKCTDFETELSSVTQENSNLKELLQNVQNEKGATNSLLLLAQEQAERMRHEWKVTKTDLLNKIQELEDEVLSTKQTEDAVAKRCTNLEKKVALALGENLKQKELLQNVEDEKRATASSLVLAEEQVERMKQEKDNTKYEYQKIVEQLKVQIHLKGEELTSLEGKFDAQRKECQSTLQLLEEEKQLATTLKGQLAEYRVVTEETVKENRKTMQEEYKAKMKEAENKIGELLIKVKNALAEKEELKSQVPAVERERKIIQSTLDEKLTEIRNLERRLQTLIAQQEKAGADYDLEVERCTRLEQRLASEQQVSSDLRVKIEALSSDLHMEKQGVNRYEEKLSSLESLLTELQAKLDDSTKEHDKLYADLTADFEAKILLVQNEKDTIKEEHKALTKKLTDNKETSVRELESQLSIERQTSKTLKKEAEDMANMCSEQRSRFELEISDMQQEQKNIQQRFQHQISEMNQHLLDVERQLSEKEEEITILSKDLASSHKKETDLKNQISSLELQVTEVEQVQQKKKNEIRDLTSQLNIESQACKTLKKEVENMASLCSDQRSKFESEIHDVQQQQMHVQQKLQNQITEMSQQMHDMERKLLDKERSASELSRGLATEGKKKAEVESQIIFLEARIKEFEQLRQQKEMGFRELESQLNIERQTCKTLEKELDKMSRLCSDQHSKFENEIHGIQQEKLQIQEGLHDQLSELNSQMLNLKQKVADKDSAISELSRDVAVLEEKRGALLNQVSFLEAQHEEAEKEALQKIQELQDAHASQLQWFRLQFSILSTTRDTLEEQKQTLTVQLRDALNSVDDLLLYVETTS